MAYSTANRPFLQVACVAGGPNAGSSDAGMNQWAYRSSDVLATVITSGYFTDGYGGGVSNRSGLGMRVGDIVNFLRMSTAVPGVPQAFHTLVISCVTTNGASPTVIGSSSS